MTPEDHLASLLASEASGATPQFLHFWGHQRESDGSAGRGALSQWFPARFTLDGDTYATAEHWMMVSKARLFGDDEAADRVLAADSPAVAKAIGREVRGYDESVWRAERFGIVVAGSVAKFGQDDALLRVLLDTGDRVLVEASPHDRIWGIGLGAGDPAASQPSRWKGLNLLGFALMEAREHLRERNA